MARPWLERDRVQFTGIGKQIPGQGNAKIQGADWQGKQA
jgi:hypothetical protein